MTPIERLILKALLDCDIGYDLAHEIHEELTRPEEKVWTFNATEIALVKNLVNGCREANPGVLGIEEIDKKIGEI